MRIAEFEWDDDNVLHLTLGHGIEPDEAEEVLANAPLVRKTKRGHYAFFGKSFDGRLMVIVAEQKGRGLIRVITGWDMKDSEIRYYRKETKR